MFTVEEINAAIANPRIIVKKGMFPNTPSWEEFINHLNFQFHDKKNMADFEDIPINPEDTIINGVNIREHFYLMIDEVNESYFPGKIDSIAKQLKSVLPEHNEYFGSFSLINFVGNERPINIHADPRHSFYWQTHGTSIWETWDTYPAGDVNQTGYDDNPDHVDTVEQGDIIFVPHGVWHSVKTLEPRTAISFMYSMDAEDCVLKKECPDHYDKF